MSLSTRSCGATCGKASGACFALVRARHLVGATTSWSCCLILELAFAGIVLALVGNLCWQVGAGWRRLFHAGPWGGRPWKGNTVLPKAEKKVETMSQVCQFYNSNTQKNIIDSGYCCQLPLLFLVSHWFGFSAKERASLDQGQCFTESCSKRSTSKKMLQSTML